MYISSISLDSGLLLRISDELRMRREVSIKGAGNDDLSELVANRSIAKSNISVNNKKGE